MKMMLIMSITDDFGEGEEKSYTHINTYMTYYTYTRAEKSRTHLYTKICNINTNTKRSLLVCPWKIQLIVSKF